MPPTGTRCIMTVKDDIFGFNEVHVHTSTNIDTVRKQLISLFKARMALCGPPAQPFKGRMSVLGSRRKVAKLNAVEISQVNTTPVFAQLADKDGPLGPNTSDQPKSCILAKGVATTGTDKSIFLAGVPDPAIGELPVGPRVVFIPGYQKLFDAYKGELTNGNWGYVGRDTDAAHTKPLVITEYGIDGPTNFTTVHVVGAANLFPKGTPVMIRGVTMTNKAYKSAEGQWLTDSATDNVAPPGTATVVLRNSVGVQIGQIVDRGTIEYVLYITLVYADVYPEAQTTRKRGNRTLVGPGRQTKRRKISL